MRFDFQKCFELVHKSSSRRGCQKTWSYLNLEPPVAAFENSFANPDLFCFHLMFPATSGGADSHWKLHASSDSALQMNFCFVRKKRTKFLEKIFSSFVWKSPIPRRKRRRLRLAKMHADAAQLSPDAIKRQPVYRRNWQKSPDQHHCCPGNSWYSTKQQQQQHLWPLPVAVNGLREESCEFRNKNKSVQDSGNASTPQILFQFQLFFIHSLLTLDSDKLSSWFCWLTW